MLFGSSQLCCLFVPNDMRLRFSVNNTNQLGFVADTGVNEGTFHFDFGRIYVESKKKESEKKKCMTDCDL